MLSVHPVVGDVNVSSLKIDSVRFLHLYGCQFPPVEAALSLCTYPLPQQTVIQWFSIL